MEGGRRTSGKEERDGLDGRGEEKTPVLVVWCMSTMNASLCTSVFRMAKRHAFISHKASLRKSRR